MLIDSIPFMEIDRAPGVAFQAGVEKARWVWERSALGERHLDDALVGLAGADHSIVIPNRNASPLPLLDHLRVSLLDESAEMGERLAPPVAQFPDRSEEHTSELQSPMY